MTARDLIRQQHGVLKAVEWSGTEHDSVEHGWDHPGCPFCEGTKPGSGDSEYEGHAPNCALRAAIDAGDKYLSSNEEEE